MIKLEGQKLVLSGPLVMDTIDAVLSETGSAVAKADLTVDF